MRYQHLKIEAIELYQSGIKLKEPFVISLGLLDHAENVIVVIRTDRGISGFGECSPFKTINGESMATCFIVGHYLASALKELNALNIEDCHKTMNAVIYGNASIKSAFDIALHDIASQNAELPLYLFLGGSNSKELITDFTVSFGAPEKMAADALKIVDRGFPVIKVKLGGSIETDIMRIACIREAVGPEIPIRIDANQGWNTEDAIKILNALDAFNIQHCEEPIARWNYTDLASIRAKSPIPIMADESCCDEHDAQRLINLSSCDLFNVKLGKSSGFFRAMKIIKLAEKANMKMQVGGFLESRLGFTAAAHLALVSDNVIHFDFDTPLMFREDPVSGGIEYDSKGVVKIPDEIGLGAAMDAGYLSSLQHVIV
jgi:L-alanine-DL-glutamate epimerase-like enolase superfamily enzyme